MNHREAWASLEGYLDGALGASERWAVSAHLDDCPICRRHLANEARLRGAVRDRLLAIDTPPGLTSRLHVALASEAGPATRVEPVSWQFPPLLRIVALLGPALVALWLVVQVTGPMASFASDMQPDLAVAHELFARDESLFDVTGDAGVVSSWFLDKAGVEVTPPAIAGFEITGGRLIALRGEPVAQLIYESRPGDAYLSLMRFSDKSSWAQDALGSTEMVAGREGDTALVTWPAAGGRAALVGKLPELELRRLAGELAAWTEGPSAADS